jgi:hypothetical protein
LKVENRGAAAAASARQNSIARSQSFGRKKAAAQQHVIHARVMQNNRRLQRLSNHIAPAATAGWAAVYKTDEPQPALPHRSLRGLTLFVTGASRGIGLAIALRAARDGANIVIAAKSETEDPRLSPATVTQHVRN